jgi:leucyl aminopeptidase
MDIAGTSFREAAKPSAPAGATGEGVGTIASLVRRMAAKS